MCAGPHELASAASTGGPWTDRHGAGLPCGAAACEYPSPDHDREPRHRITSEEPATAGGHATALLIDAGAVRASSLDVAATMDQVARLLVPRLADLCTIDLLLDDGSISGVGVASSRNGLAPDLESLRRRFPLDAAGEHPVARVIRRASSSSGPSSAATICARSRAAKRMRSS